MSVGGASAAPALRASAGGATLTHGSGATDTWSATDSGWTPPAGSDGRLSRDALGALGIDDGGTNMVFDTAGRLASATTALDDASPASPVLATGGATSAVGGAIGGPVGAAKAAAIGCGAGIVGQVGKERTPIPDDVIDAALLAFDLAGAGNQCRRGFTRVVRGGKFLGE